MLGLKPGATEDDIRTAFKALNRKHRERDRELLDQARQVTIAFETLRDPSRRRAYDAALGVEPEPQHDSTSSWRPGGDQKNPIPTPAAQAQPAPAQQPPVTGLRETSAPEAPKAPEASVKEKKPPPKPVRDPRPDPLASSQPRAANTAPRAVEPVPPLVFARGPQPNSPASEGPALHPRGQTDDRAQFTSAPSHDWSDEDVAPERNRSWMGVAGVVLGAALFIPLALWQWQGSKDDVGGAPAQRNVAKPVAHPLPGRGSLSATLSQSLQNAGIPSPFADQDAQPPEVEPQVASNKLPTHATSETSAKPAIASDAGQPDEAAPEEQTSSDAPGADPLAPAPAATAAEQSSPSPPPPPPVPARPPAPVVNRAASAKWLGGGLQASDNPRGEFEGTVSVRFTVGPSGRASGCQAIVSSGNPALDARTCQLLEQRLLFSPALDARGRPTAMEVRNSYSWGRKRRQ
jgi:protein TonB